MIIFSIVRVQKVQNNLFFFYLVVSNKTVYVSSQRNVRRQTDAKQIITQAFRKKNHTGASDTERKKSTIPIFETPIEQVFPGHSGHRCSRKPQKHPTQRPRVSTKGHFRGPGVPRAERRREPALWNKIHRCCCGRRQGQHSFHEVNPTTHAHYPHSLAHNSSSRRANLRPHKTARLRGRKTWTNTKKPCRDSPAILKSKILGVVEIHHTKKCPSRATSCAVPLSLQF